MHEVGLMRSAIDLALEQVKAQGRKKIHRIDLSVGELSGVGPDALMFAFDVVSKVTLAEVADLHLMTEPTLVYCTYCRREFHPMSWIYACPHCQHLSNDIREGKDLKLVSLEIS